MVQTVSRQLLATKASFKPTPVGVDFVVDNLELEFIFLKSFSLPLSVSGHQSLIFFHSPIHSFIFPRQGKLNQSFLSPYVKHKCT